MPALLERLASQESANPRPMSRRVATLHAEIESALVAGYTRAHIVGALADEGITLSASTLSTYLYRLRKRRLAKLSASEPPPAPRADRGALSATASSSTVDADTVPPAPERAPHPKPSPRTAPADSAPSGVFSEIARNKPDLAALRKLGKAFHATLHPDKPTSK